MHAELDEIGFVLQRGCVDAEAQARLLRLCDPNHASTAVRHRSGVAYAARGLLWVVPTLTEELAVSGVTSLASLALRRPSFPIDAIFFDKSLEANWTVPGHQDRLMPVEASPAARSRDGVPYAQPSAEVLAGLLALRVHFDDSDEESGALRFVGGSHRRGIIPDPEIVQTPVERYRACPASRGDVVLMRPLILHRSSPSQARAPRRVLHVVYATEQPSDGLVWHATA